MQIHRNRVFALLRSRLILRIELFADRNSNSLIAMKHLIASAAGGAAPSILTLAISLTCANAKLPDLTFLVGVGILALLGGVGGWVSQETNLDRGFLLVL